MTDDLLFFTDLHFWEVVKNPLRLLGKRLLGNANVALRRRHHFPMENARPIAQHAIGLGVKNLLIGGDLTSTATLREFELAREFLAFLTAEGLCIRMVPGNHDVYTFEASRRRRFEEYFSEWVPRHGYPTYERLEGGTELIMLATVRPNLISSAGLVTDESVQFVAETLARVSGPAVVMGHYPLMDQTPEYELSKSRRLRGSERLREALGSSPQKVLHLAGHVHQFSSMPDPTYPNVHHVTGPALFNRWAPASRNGGFLRLRVGDAGIDVQHHYLKEAWRMEETHVEAAGSSGERGDSAEPGPPRMQGRGPGPANPE